MRSPFPGMDPQLKRDWGDVGGSLAVTAKVALDRELGGDPSAGSDRRLLMDTFSLPAGWRGEYRVSVWRAYTGKVGRREGYGLRLRDLVDPA